MRLCSKEKKNFTVNFGTREKISQKDGGILTVVREQAGLPSPGSVTSLQKVAQASIYISKVPQQSSNSKQGWEDLPWEVRHPREQQGQQGHTCEPGLSLSAKKTTN